jgi:hypothetical protein
VTLYGMDAGMLLYFQNRYIVTYRKNGCFLFSLFNLCGMIQAYEGKMFPFLAFIGGGPHRAGLKRGLEYACSEYNGAGGDQ